MQAWQRHHGARPAGARKAGAHMMAHALCLAACLRLPRLLLLLLERSSTAPRPAPWPPTPGPGASAGAPSRSITMAAASASAAGRGAECIGCLVKGCCRRPAAARCAGRSEPGAGRQAGRRAPALLLCNRRCAKQEAAASARAEHPQSSCQWMALPRCCRAPWQRSAAADASALAAVAVSWPW